MELKNDEVLNSRIITLTGTITTLNIDETIQKIIYLNSLNTLPIQLIINSCGGELQSTFALIDIIRTSTSPVNTVGLGLIASGGLLVFMAGKERKLTANTQILSHRFSGWSYGKHNELLSERKQQDICHDMMINYYKSVTGLNKKELEGYLLRESDTWLTPNEAVNYKIATKVVDTIYDSKPKMINKK